MRSNWTYKPLGDVCDVVGGGTPSKRNTAFYEGSIPWATVRDMRDEVLYCTEFRISEDAVRNSSTKVIPSGNVVIATRVGLGKACLLAQDTAINQDLRAVIPKLDQIDTRFLLRWFQSVSNKILSEGTGATVKGVKLPFIKSLQLPMPSLGEQKRIVAILDEAFEGIDTVVANTEKNLANVRDLFTSFLGKEFEEVKNGSGEVRIDSACESVIDCVNKTAPKVDEPTPYKMIRTTNVRNGFVSLESVKYVTEEVYEKWTRRQVPMSGDVILTREAPMGEVGLLDTEEKVFLGQRLVSYRADRTKLVPEFLLYAFQSPYMQRQIHSFASGSTVQHMRVPDCKKLMLPLPDLDTQWGVVERLKFLRDEVSRVESNYQQKLTALAELKQSLLHKAFSGELTAREAEAAVEEAMA